MSEHPPHTSPEHPPEPNTEHVSDPAEVLEAHTVPPTPEPPHNEIEATRERLAAATHEDHPEEHKEEGATEDHAPEAPAASSSHGQTPAATTSSTESSGPAKKASLLSKMPNWMKGGFAIFGFILVHWIWEPLKHAAKDFDLGKGGGGGGHKKDDHGHGGGHGGGHH